MKRLLEVRKSMKAKKPEFIMQDAHKKKELKWRWRRPQGSDSKMRVRRYGYRKMPSIGFKAPRAVRGLSSEGLIPVRIHTLHELQAVKKGQGIMIGRTVGIRRKIELLSKAKEMNIPVLNIRNPLAYIERQHAYLSERRQLKQQKQSSKEKKKKETKSKKPEELAETLTAAKEGRKEENGSGIDPHTVMPP